MTRLCSLLAVLLTACADAPAGRSADGDRGDSLGGTERMVERLAGIAAGIDQRQSQFAAAARVEELLARGSGSGLEEQLSFARQLSEMLLYAGRFQEATDSMKALLEAIDAAQGPNHSGKL